MAKRLAVPAELQHLVEKRDVTRRASDRRKGTKPEVPSGGDRRKTARRKKSERRREI